MKHWFHRAARATATPPDESSAERLEQIDAALRETNSRLQSLDRVERQLRQQGAQIDFIANHGASYLGDGIALTHLPDETPIFVNSNDYGSPMNFVSGGRYEDENLAVLLSLVDDDTVFVDVGANLGYFSLRVAQRLVRGKVLAFEPQPGLVDLMRRTLHLNGLRDQVEVHPVGLSDESGTLAMEIPVGHAGGAQIPTQLSRRWNTLKYGEVQRQSVEVRVFDELVPADFRCQLVKIDVEGYELSVLRGMRRTLERSPDATVLLEKMIRGYGDERELWTFFQSLGMRVYAVLDGGWLRPFADSDALADWDHGYILATRREDMAVERDRRRFRIGPRQLRTPGTAAVRESDQGARLEVESREVLVFGPYWSLPRGSWRLRVLGEYDHDIELILKARLGQQEIGRWRLSPEHREVEFSVDHELVKFECVLHALGMQSTRLCLQGIELRRRDGTDPGGAPLESPPLTVPTVLSLPVIRAHASDHRQPARSLAFLSNCQGQVLSGVIQALTGGAAPSVHAVGQRAIDDPARLVSAVQQVAREHDVLLMQPMTARTILPLMPEMAGRIELFPSVVFPAFHPDICYVYRRGREEYLQGALGPYHSSIVYHAWRVGLSAREAVGHFRGEVYEALSFYDYWESSTRQLLDEGQAANLPLDALLARWRRQGCFMHTHNHPRRGPLIDVATALLKRMGVVCQQPDSEEFVHDPLSSSEIWPVYPELASRLGVRGSLVFKASNGNQEVRTAAHLLDLETFVAESYTAYELAGREVLSSDRPYTARYAAVFGTPTRLQGRVSLSGADKSDHPYRLLPSERFWRQAVASAPEIVDPVRPRWTLSRDTRLATAGSCFAQHIARALTRRGVPPMQLEPAPASLSSVEARAAQYGIYSARYGNLYTARQLLQLLWRAFGRFDPQEPAWQRPDGRWIDPFRPEIEPAGFETPAAMLDARRAHLDAVRRMFESVETFVFTLGLTEAWYSMADGAVFPLAPGVSGGRYDPAAHGFGNAGVESVRDDLLAFLEGLAAVNPQARVLFTVSPVPLAATYEDCHVLTATARSKAVLRAAVDEVISARPQTDYFPAYELVAGSQAGLSSFGADGRSVTPGTVEQVMQLFFTHYLPELPPPESDCELLDEANRLNRLFCEEERLAQD